LQLFARRLNEQKSWRKLDIDYQRGHYYEHCSRSIVPQELKGKQQTAMSAPPLYQSAGLGDLLFWGKKKTMAVLWESLSQQEKESGLEEASTMHHWVVWCKSKKGAEGIRSFELSGKGIFSDHDETK